MANIALSSGTPTVTTTGLTAGAGYSIQHIGGIKAEVQVGASAGWLLIYAAGKGPGCYIPALCGTTIRWSLDGSSASAEITLTASA